MKAKRKTSQNPYEPPQDEIRKECQELQNSWTSEERRKRAGMQVNNSWTPPHVKIEAPTEEENRI